MVNQENKLYHDYENYMERITRICKDFHIDSLLPRIAAVSEVLNESNVINVALVGGFKAGKSSFLNSIIGRNILPVAVLPITSVITYIRYGPSDKAQVRFLNGKAKDIQLNELAEFITEENNPENTKQVARVDVELADIREYAGLQFVDTPGFGSAYIHNTLTSEEWLPRIGVAFLAVNVTHPLSEEDISLLKDLKNHTSEIIILLTKTDLVSSEEARGVVEFIRAQVRQHLNKDLQILSFSNKSGFEPLRQEACDFIRRSIGENYIQKSKEIINHKFRSILSSCREYLMLAMSAANSTQESRAQLTRQLQQEHRLLSDIQNEIHIIAVDLRIRLQSEASNKFLEHRLQLTTQLTNELKEQMPQWKGNLAKTSETFQGWIVSNLMKQLKIISNENGLRLSDYFLNIALTSFSRVVRAFQDRLSKDIESALNIKFNVAAFEAQIENPKQPDVRIGNVFMTPWEIIWFLVPMWLFRPLINRHFVRLIPWEAEKNLSRLAAQWTEAISVSVDKLAKQAEVFIMNELATVENVLANSPDHQKEIEKAISELEVVRTEI